MHVLNGFCVVSSLYKKLKKKLLKLPIFYSTFEKHFTVKMNKQELFWMTFNTKTS